MYKLIIVDDETLTRNFLKQIIPTLSNDWEIVGDATDGLEALELIKSQSVDLVLTDIKMPVMDGLELCKRIQNQYSHIHCVILSGYGEFDYAKKALKHNVYNYLLKPIINEELQNMLMDIASICEKEKRQKNKYSALIHSSAKYKEEITAKFLKAIITQNHIEIKTLYPVLSNLNQSLIETKGLIVILQITEDLLINNNISLSKLQILKQLLFETAKAQIINTSISIFIDLEDNTVLYVPSDNNCDFMDLIKHVYETINTTFYNESKINIFCTAGSKENDILNMNISYEYARTTFLQYLFHRDLKSTVFIYTKNLYNEKIKSLHSYINSIVYIIHNNDSIQLQLISEELGDFIFNNIINSKRMKFFCTFIRRLQNNINSNECSSINPYELLIESNINLDDLSCLSKLIIKISNCFIINDQKNNPICDTNQLVEQAKQYIYNHYMEPISLSLIADKLSVTSAYLSNLFHQVEGKSYIKFLTQVRLKHAENLLKNENMNLETVTKKVGYLSVKHFSSVFKKYYQISPGEYRKRFR